MTLMRAALLTAIAALVALNWYVFQLPIETSALRMDGAPQPTTATPVIEPMPSFVADDNALEERPLFNATRRPFVAPLTIAEPVAPDVAPPQITSQTEASGLKLIGVMHVGKQDRRALLRFGGAPNGLWLPVGGEVNGWRVSEITKQEIVVSKSGATERLAMHRRQIEIER